ncbi:MAG: transporter, ATP-binding protein [Myxococcaceae bacterium]|nr:transporter, ATP-binding protein [Myxococcaceae bacterium]
MIQVSHLTKRYGERVAVRDLSFEVARGEVVGFLGPNGAGKSTTLRMLTGFLEPSDGDIKIDGLDAQKAPLEVKRRIGYMPEAVPLYLEMRVAEYLRFRAELKGVPRRAIAKNVDRALELASVVDVKTRIIGQLSKGYRQRVGLADALVADPPLLILDEPTAGLDPNQIRQVRDLIRELAREKTVLLSTHILPEVEALCGRVIILDRGRLVSSGKPSELRGAGGSGSSITLEARANADKLGALLAGLSEVRGTPHIIPLGNDGVVRARVEVDVSELDRAAERIFRTAADAGIDLRELRRADASLEDVFARLTTHDPSSEAAPTEAAASTSSRTEVSS